MCAILDSESGMASVKLEREELPRFKGDLGGNVVRDFMLLVFVVEVGAAASEDDDMVLAGCMCVFFFVYPVWSLFFGFLSVLSFGIPILSTISSFYSLQDN